MAKDNSSERGTLAQGAAIVDLSIPQTKLAQRLTPYEGPVPSYVLDLERGAEEMELTVRRMWDSKCTYWNRLLLFFAGTKKQISEFSIFTHPENITWPSTTRLATKAYIRHVVPQQDHRCPDQASVHRVADDRYLICVTVDLPIRMEWASQDVERLEFQDFRDELRTVYIGSSEALIKAGVVSPSFFPDEFEESGESKDWISEQVSVGGFTGITRSLLRLSNGKWSYAENRGWIGKVEEAKGEERKWRAPTPEEWLEQREDMICGYARAILVQFQETDLEDLGVRYSANFQEIVDAIEVAAQRIREVKVTVQPLSAKPPVCANAGSELREVASAAASDKPLQSFLKQALAQAENAGRGSGRAPKQ